MNGPWRIQLLGAIAARDGDDVVARFATTRTAALAARLALFPHRSHPREELIDLIWPDSDIEKGRLNLRVALASLRRQLEPPGFDTGSVLIADRNSVRANPDAIRCDAVEFESALKEARSKTGASKRTALERAAELYGGEFMPGLWDEWVLLERERLDALYDKARIELESLSGPAEAETTAMSPREVRIEPATNTNSPSLPILFSRFFGRDREISRLSGLLREQTVRLVTIVGPSGVGKTRLAIEAARRMAAHFAGRVHFVPLAGTASASLLANRVAEALRMQLTGERPIHEQISAFLGDERHLVVLDNLEHLGEPVAEEIRRLIGATAAVTFLCTSQRLLGIEGEIELALKPLPAPRHEDAPERLIEYPSIRLFVDRAQAVRFDFQITLGNGEAVAAVCRQLEGIPLAIELAAARINTLTPSQMREQINARFEFLTSRRRDLAPRHQSLRAALEWSVQLLSPEQTGFYKQLSVFRGGWSLEAAREVCQSAAALDLLEQLRERSLIMSEDSVHGLRFRMLESLREYASEQLTEGEREHVARRHALYFVGLAMRMEQLWYGPRQHEGVDILDSESDNMRAALAFCRDSAADADWAAVDTGLQLAGSLGSYWSTRGLIREGLEWLEGAIARGGSKPARARALREAGWIAAGLGRYEQSAVAFEEAIAIFRELGDKLQTAWALRSRGSSLIWREKLGEARRDLEESLALSLESGHDRTIAAAMNALGVLSHASGEDNQVARGLYEEALSRFRRCGDRQFASYCLHNLGDIMREMGDYERAEELVLESLRLAEEIGEVWQKAYCLMTLGCTLAAHGDLDRAEPELRQALELTRRLGDRQTEAVILCHMAEAARKGKKLPEARARYEQSLAIRSDLGEAAGYALCRVGLAEVAADAEDWVGTAREMALAEQTPGSITGAEIERRMRALRARIARAGASKRTNVKF